MNIPDKDWNAEKGIMEDTSLPEWQEYYRKLQAHEDHYRSIEPMPWSFRNYTDYESAYAKWDMNRSLFKPNKPGYYRAAND